MTDFTWPDDLAPFAMSFYLQPYSGGSESPFSRQTKTYGLAAPRWVAALSFRGGYDGTAKQAAYGPRLDTLLSKLKGREHRALFYDFRRSIMRTQPWTLGIGNLAASAGATSITITGLQPGAAIYNGDYVGGDGRPHIIGDTAFGAVHAVADAAGQAVVSFEPPLKAAIGLNAVVFGNPTGRFMLTEDDAGQNGVEVGQSVTMTLNFVEDIS